MASDTYGHYEDVVIDALINESDVIRTILYQGIMALPPWHSPLPPHRAN
jgi:hypothetical protein